MTIVGTVTFILAAVIARTVSVRSVAVAPAIAFVCAVLPWLGFGLGVMTLTPGTTPIDVPRLADADSAIGRGLTAPLRAINFISVFPLAVLAEVPKLGLETSIYFRSSRTVRPDAVFITWAAATIGCFVGFLLVRRAGKLRTLKRHLRKSMLPPPR